MRRFLLIALFAVAACGPKSGSKTPKDNFDADARSGPDAKRSSAQKLELNKPHTDEVNYQNQDRTDWYEVELKGQPGVLTTLINWDNVGSDVNIDVFDAFGAQIAASPVRGKGEMQKKLFTQIDKPGTYYVRVTAPTKSDGTVYTMEAQWQEPPAVAVSAPPPVEAPPPPEEKPKHHATHEPRQEREKPAGESIQARVVSAYREGAALMLYIDKGSAAGIKPGDSGVVLQGSGGEDPVDGGVFRVVKVIDANKCVGSASLHSLGKNNRVAITLSR
ncbi:MAG TPA: PPC domain-containing protein [Polyangia bacterium]